ncbi:MAG: GMC family oxidoreductase [Chloroflexi bacterium]|nr:GMC family oxidoreductase [Chloroflexota bacterium]
MDHYDVIIIGTGAGGGTMARALAPTGKRILILERGGYLPRERENWDTRAVFIEHRYSPDETWHHAGKAFNPSHPHYYVGGSTKVYGAALLRLRERDFEEVEHAGGVSPAWPITYADLEPYYNRAEKWYYVHGEAGLDPTEPPRSEPFPYAPLPHEPRIEKLNRDLKALGLNPYPLPMGVRLGTEDGAQGPETVLSLFDGYPDPTLSKADSHVCGIIPALEHDNVTLKTHHRVTRLNTDATGRRVASVTAETAGGDQVSFSADTVVLAAGAINSAALLLRSANEHHPDGLANSSGLVGCHYMSHNNQTFVAVGEEPNDAIFQKTLALADFYFESDAWEHPMGLIQMLGKVDELLMKFESPEPLGGMTHAEMAQHSLDFWLQSEDLPDAENRVALNAAGEIEFHYTANNLEARDRLTETLRGMLHDLGCRDDMVAISYYLGQQFPFNLAHQMGTLRFGTDPAASVLDPLCRAHDLDNLYVTDGGFFVSAGAVNPTLTIIAQTLRVADHLTAEVL